MTTITTTRPDAVDLAGILAQVKRDMAEAISTLTDREARYLVDTYYQMQENRKRADNQVRSISDEPHRAITWINDQAREMENTIKWMLGKYANSKEIGLWSQSVLGIGPVIAAGLMAHIDITKAPTVGHVWRFAGLDPTRKWEKKTKRPWNAALKTLCWKIGESFVKVSGKDTARYGQVYLERKEYEIARNEAGELADQATAVLTHKKIGKDKVSYYYYAGLLTVEAAHKLAEIAQTRQPTVATVKKLIDEENGTPMLPPAHIHSRAKRYAVKLFLSHWHETAYVLEYDKKPPLPYPIAILGHGHKSDP